MKTMLNKPLKKCPGYFDLPAAFQHSSKCPQYEIVANDLILKPSAVCKKVGAQSL